jgi:hypothetical protein
MKKILGLIALSVSAPSFAVEGYKDIYLDREKTVYIHGITCAPDANNLRAFKGSIVYTNTKSIEKGTYYFDSPYGKYSYTFNSTKNPAVLGRGRLTEGQTAKSQMEKNVCIISKIEGLPAPLLKSIDTVILQPDDPDWATKMKQYAFVAGKPAYAKGVYEDTRAASKNAADAKKIYDASQQYIAAIETIFTEKFNRISNELPQKVTDAVQYAHQESGSFEAKVYPGIEEPAVWTAVAKERYNDLVRQRGQRIEWDQIMQQNFDWLFGLVGEDNNLESTALLAPSKLKWNGAVLEQLATVQAVFSNGKKLELDFLITSSKVDTDIFASMADIEKAILLSQTSAIVANRREIKPIKPPTEDSLSVYSPTRKVVVFFSDFRADKLAGSYRYK